MEVDGTTPGKGKGAPTDVGGPSATAESSIPSTPMQSGARPQIGTVPHPMVTPIRSRMHELEARLQELETAAPTAISQQQADACMQQLALAFQQLQAMTAQIPKAIDERIQNNLLPLAQQMHENVGGVGAALLASQQAAANAQNAAHFTAQASQQIQQFGEQFSNVAGLAAPAVTMMPNPPMPPPEARMLEEEFSNPEPIPNANPMNPKLPPYSGAEDPDFWILQVKACFAANKTPEDQKGPWMVCALRGEAAQFWLIQCAEKVPALPHLIAEKLRARFRPPSYHHNLMARLTALKMQAGNFSAYADKFLLLTAQLPELADKTKMSLFLNGLAQPYRLPVELRDATTFDEVLETARRVDATMRSAPSTNLHVSLETANTAAARFRSSSSWQSQSTGRGYGRGQGYRGRGRWRSGSRNPRAPSVRPEERERGNYQNAQPPRGPPRDQSRSMSQPRVGNCSTCGKPGHWARDCYQNKFHPDANAQGRGRGRGGNTWRGRGRGPPQGNALQ